MLVCPLIHYEIIHEIVSTEILQFLEADFELNTYTSSFDDCG